METEEQVKTQERRGIGNRGMGKNTGKKIWMRRQNRGLEKCRKVKGRGIWNGGIHNTGVEIYKNCSIALFYT